jgi:protein gp37
MGTATTIEWTDATWNPTRGCSRVSPGCANCYAEFQANRQRGPGRAYAGLVGPTKKGPRWTGEIRVVEDRFDLPRRWRKPKRVFVNSMSDLFHEKVPLEAQGRIFKTMVEANHHTYQILTKRPKRAAEVLVALGVDLSLHPHIWLGVSVENREYGLPRVDVLRQIPAAVRSLSVEPLLEDLGELNLAGIHWVIVGGESGRKARPMDGDWVRSIRDQCAAAGVAFHFKQWGGWPKKVYGRELDGRTHDAYPSVPARDAAE